MYHDTRAGSHPSANADVIRGHESDPTRGLVRAGGRQANRQTTDSTGKARHDAMTSTTDAHHRHRFLIGQWGDEDEAHGASVIRRAGTVTVSEPVRTGTVATGAGIVDGGLPVVLETDQTVKLCILCSLLCRWLKKQSVSLRLRHSGFAPSAESRLVIPRSRRVGTMGPPTISQEADDLTIDFNRQIGGRLAAVFATEQASLRAGGVPIVSVAPGANLPNAPLIDAEGLPAWLYDALGSDGAVVVFYRGAWCPHCNLALAHYQRELLPRLLERGLGLVAISPQTPTSSNLSIAEGALEFTVLSDPANSLATAIGILTEPTPEARYAHTELGFDPADSNADATGGVPFPTVLVVDSDRIVRFADVQVDYTRRTEVADILAAVDALQ